MPQFGGHPQRWQALEEIQTRLVEADALLQRSAIEAGDAERECSELQQATLNKELNDAVVARESAARAEAAAREAEEAAGAHLEMSIHFMMLIT